VLHTKWNMHSLHELSNMAASKTISFDRCSEGWSCWTLEHCTD